MKFCKPDLKLFCIQIAIIFIVVCTSLVNLTFQYGNQDLWIMILTSSLGYIMPNPNLKIIDANSDKSSIKAFSDRNAFS